MADETTVTPRLSWRDAIGARLRERGPWLAVELLLGPLLIGLRLAGVIRNPSLLILFVGQISLWLRRSGWRAVGLRAPASWRRTILLAVGIGIAYDLVDIFVFLPALKSLTGQSVQLDQVGQIAGNPAILVYFLTLTWTLAAFGEELACRGYLLNRFADGLGGSRAAFLAAAAVVSVLFGLAHKAQGVAGMIDNILAGVLFASLYLATGRNLWLPILVHGVVDTFSFALLYLGFRLP